MKINKFLEIKYVVNLFEQLVKEWHCEKYDITNLENLSGLKKFYVKLMYHNFTLWHFEDKARVKNISDAVIADVKRNIDVQNQLRNDTIELIDVYIQNLIKKIPLLKKSYNATETPGAAIDRLSILCLKIFHMREETVRKDADSEHITKCKNKLFILELQKQDLIKSINLLVEKIYSGEIEHKIYRQMKMYNDPSLNPEVYKNSVK